MYVMEGLVLDNSVTMSQCFPDEHDPYAQDVLRALPGTAAAVPTLWPLEAANILLVGERRGRISQADSATFIGLLAGLPIRIDDETSDHALPLATLDAKLKAAAVAIGITIYTVPRS